MEIGPYRHRRVGGIFGCVSGRVGGFSPRHVLLVRILLHGAVFVGITLQSGRLCRYVLTCECFGWGIHSLLLPLGRLLLDRCGWVVERRMGLQSLTLRVQTFPHHLRVLLGLVRSARHLVVRVGLSRLLGRVDRGRAHVLEVD